MSRLTTSLALVLSLTSGALSAADSRIAHFQTNRVYFGSGVNTAISGWIGNGSVSVFPYATAQEAISFQPGLPYNTQVVTLPLNPPTGTTSTVGTNAFTYIVASNPPCLGQVDVFDNAWWSTGKIVDASIRGYVGSLSPFFPNPVTGRVNLTVTLTITGTQPKNLRLKAWGPALAPYLGTGYNPDPRLSVSGNGVYLSNDNANGTLDAQIDTTLNPGTYTLVADSTSNGVVLLEATDLNP